VSVDRERLLDEMGLSPRWVLRERPSIARAVRTSAAAAPVVATPVAAVAAATAASVAAVSDAALDVPRASPFAAAASADALPVTGASAPDVAQFGWDALRHGVAECQLCGLCRQRKQAVLGVGDENADWLFVGEGPGAEEDERGEPFVGAAGKLLDAMLASIDLTRGRDVYIANAVKCRPPGNRTPEAAELAACAPYLARQIALIRPRLIVLLGRVAVQAVLGEDRALAGLRGKTLAYRDIPVVVTYHPAYLLRNLPDKAKAWEDLCRARALMRALKVG
jgi:DNA polymerase